MVEGKEERFYLFFDIMDIKSQTVSWRKFNNFLIMMQNVGD